MQVSISDFFLIETYLVVLILSLLINFSRFNDLRILISKKNEELDNFLLVEKENDENLYKLKLKNFSFEFLNSFSKYKDINFEKLVISGKSSFYTNRDTFFQSLEDHLYQTRCLVITSVPHV